MLLLSTEDSIDVYCTYGLLLSTEDSSRGIFHIQVVCFLLKIALKVITHLFFVEGILHVQVVAIY